MFHFCQDNLRIELYLFLWVFGQKLNLEKLYPNTIKIMYKNTWKIIQNLQLYISNQARHYSSVKALCGQVKPVLQVLEYWDN